jgi:hypothetical protein
MNMCDNVINVMLSSVSGQTIEKSRQFARQQGISLNELLRRYMDSITRMDDVDSLKLCQSVKYKPRLSSS